MKALVTGANGFIGSAVVRQLVDADYEVRALVRRESNLANLESLPVEIIYGDVRDPDSLAGIARNCDVLFHIAADYRLWARNTKELYDTNVSGTHNILDEAINSLVPRIVYTSSVATVGLNKNDTPADESNTCQIEDAVGHYKRSKLLAETEVLWRAANQQLLVTVVNPAAPIGPRDYKPTPTGRIVVDAATGKMPAYVDTGLCIVHVDDVARGHLLALKHGKPGERYILGGDNLSLHEILREICALGERKPPQFRLPYAAVLPVAVLAEGLAKLTGREPRVGLDAVRMARHSMYFTSEKAQKELGYTHRPAAEALRDAFDWFQEHGYVH